MKAEDLEKLGLTKNEATVYLALLELGSTNADPIIKKTGFHRSIVYDNLEKLISKGLVSFVIQANRKYFEVTSSSQLMKWIIRQKEEILEKEGLTKNIIPEIEKIRALSKEPQEATIFKGKKGLINVLDDVILTGQPVFIFGSGWGMQTIMGHYYQQWHLKLKQNKIRAKILLSEGSRGKFLSPLKARYIPKEYAIPSTTLIYDHKLLLIIWSEQPMAILIRSKEVSDSYKNFFEILWQNSIE